MTRINCADCNWAVVGEDRDRVFRTLAAHQRRAHSKYQGQDMSVWIGPVPPKDAKDGDIWVDTGVQPVVAEVVVRKPEPVSPHARFAELDFDL